MFDLSFCRSIPNLTIMAPADEAELRNMLHTAIESVDGPVCIRYPRGRGRGVPIDAAPSTVPLYQPRVVRKGSKVAIVSAGHALETAERVCALLAERRVDPTLVDARFIKPLDRRFYRQLFADHGHIVTLEENALTGGFGAGVMELAAVEGATSRILPIGYPDAFISHGDLSRLVETMGLTPEGIVERITGHIKSGRSRTAKVLMQK
jgi:1-deoxy-D-xylulose-5-phosphate synthase